MRLPEGAIRKVGWTYGNAPVKRLAYGVVPYKGAKIKLTAHERKHLLYVSPERHIIAYWDRRPADHRMLPNIRKHLGIEAHHLGSPVNRAMAKRLPEHEREAIAVLLAKNALIGYCPGITTDSAIILGDIYSIEHNMLTM